MNPQPGHKWFAVFWDWMVRTESGAIRRVRQEVAGGAGGRVLEIGCGNGANFGYYADGTTDLVATDPDPYMIERAARLAAQLGRPIDVRQAPAEELPFEDASFDTVVSTLVMCTVRDPAKALTEVRRVLKPGGQFRFFEHVRYDYAFGAFWQDLVTPLWRWMGAGCHPNRDTARFIAEAGFQFRQLESLKPEPPLPPMIVTRPCIKGVAAPA